MRPQQSPYLDSNSNCAQFSVLAQNAQIWKFGPRPPPPPPLSILCFQRDLNDRRILIQTQIMHNLVFGAQNVHMEIRHQSPKLDFFEKRARLPLHADVRALAFARRRARAYVCTQACTRLRLHTGVRALAFAHRRARACVRTQACARLRLHAGVRARACVCT